MPSKGSVSTQLKPIRLQTINYLRIRRPNQFEQNPCTKIMSTMLGCWASHGYNAETCGELATQLKQCMDKPKSKEQKKNTVNYHLMRMFPKVRGPRKRDGVLG